MWLMDSWYILGAKKMISGENESGISMEIRGFGLEIASISKV